MGKRVVVEWLRSQACSGPPLEAAGRGRAAEGSGWGARGRGLDLLAKGGGRAGLERGVKQRPTGGKIPEAWFYYTVFFFLNEMP